MDRACTRLLIPLMLLIGRAASGGWFSSSSPPPAPAVRSCPNPDCRKDCRGCEPAEIVTALKGSARLGDPAETWIVQFNAAKALVEVLETPGAPAHRAVVASMGGIEALLQATDATLAVQPKTDIATPLGNEEQIAELLVELITVLGSLSIDSSHNQQAIARHDGIAKIARAMSVGHHRYNNTQLVTQSCWTLTQLAKNNPANQKAIVGAGTVRFAERAINARRGRTGLCRDLLDIVRYAAKALGVQIASAGGSQEL